MANLTQMFTEMFSNPPDYDEPQPLANRRATILGSTITFLILSWCALIMRLYTRFRIVKKPGWDDFFVTFAAIMNCVGTGFVCVSIEFGFGQHFPPLLKPGSFGLVSKFLFTFYISNASYVTTTALIKISLLLQYLRIFTRGYLRFVCISLLLLVAAWGLASSFMAWVPCMPVPGYWNRRLGPRCYAYGFQDQASFVRTFEVHAAINMAFDAVVLIIPMMLYFENGLNRHQVLALTGLFALGGLTFSTSAWRLYTIVITEAATFPMIDFTWLSPLSIILSCLEIDLAIMCASMPIFWPVIAESWNRIFVTHEVRVSVHRRASKATWRRGSVGSQDSTMELTVRGKGMEMEDHYKDRYVMGYVDPFRHSREGSNGSFRTDCERGEGDGKGKL